MDRTSVIVVGLCVLLLFAWYAANLPNMREAQEVPEQQSREQATEEQQAAEEQPPAQGNSEDPREPEPDAPGPSPRPDDEAPPLGEAAPPATSPAIDSFAEPLQVQGDAAPIILSGEDTMRVRLDPAYPGIASITLLEYDRMVGEGNVELAGGRIPYLSLVYGEQMRRGRSVRVVEADRNRAVIERAFQAPAVTVTETWRLDPERPYLIHYSARIDNDGEEEVDLSGFKLLCGSLVSEETPGVGRAGTAGLVELAAATKLPQEKRPDSYKPKQIAKQSPAETAAQADTPVSWLAVHNKYFLLHCAPEKGTFRGFRIGLTVPFDPEESESPVFAAATLSRQTLGPGASQSLEFQGYAGPKKLRLLKDMGHGVDKLMRLDLFLFFHPRWMEFVTHGILRALVALNDFFGGKWGYGYAIMVITFVIKMLFWPLTHTSTVSMHRMQAIQPQLKEIKEQYKDQPQVLQQKTMELYKQHKVNPLGGCLPILLQIPVFFALFNTFRSAIELRQASFLWVQDLSLPDTLPFTPFGLPIRPLAIFMGATMLLQQMTMPTSQDPSQKKMMMFMTAFFVFIFYTMPAGLTLYWSVNQVLTIIQNMISRRLHTAQKSTAVA